MDKKEIKKKETKSEKVEKTKEVKIVKKKIKKNINNGVAYVNASFKNIDTVIKYPNIVLLWKKLQNKCSYYDENLQFNTPFFSDTNRFSLSIKSIPHAYSKSCNF